MNQDKEWLENEIKKQDVIMGKGFIYTDDILSLTKELDEPEVVIVPSFIADWIELKKRVFEKIFDAIVAIESYKHEMGRSIDYQIYSWVKSNDDIFVKAWYEGYKVKEETQYYAKIKGHELIETDITVDPGDNTDPEWYRNIYFVVEKDGELIIDTKDSGLRGARHSMTKEEWRKVGINPSNADFEEVKKIDKSIKKGKVYKYIGRDFPSETGKLVTIQSYFFEEDVKKFVVKVFDENIALEGTYTFGITFIATEEDLKEVESQ